MVEDRIAVEEERSSAVAVVEVLGSSPGVDGLAEAGGIAGLEEVEGTDLTRRELS